MCEFSQRGRVQLHHVRYRPERLLDERAVPTIACVIYQDVDGDATRVEARLELGPGSLPSKVYAFDSDIHRVLLPEFPGQALHRLSAARRQDQVRLTGCQELCELDAEAA